MMESDKHHGMYCMFSIVFQELRPAIIDVSKQIDSIILHVPINNST